MNGDINFITKTRCSFSSNSDVGIHRGYAKIKNGALSVATCNLTFRNGVADKLSRTGYIVYAVVDSRIYFKEATAREGYKLTMSHKNDDKNRYMTFSSTTHKDINEWCSRYDGEFDLQCDPKRNLWFIEGRDFQFHFK